MRHCSTINWSLDGIERSRFVWNLKYLGLTIVKEKNFFLKVLKLYAITKAIPFKFISQVNTRDTNDD